MADPFSLIGILSTLALSAGASAGLAGVSRLLAPKPKPIQRGKLEGDLFFQSSDYGQVIPIIFGADPGDGKGGGVDLAGNIIWTSGVRKKSEIKSGGKGPGQPDIEEITYDCDFAILVGRGPLTITKIWANNDLIFNALAGDGDATGVYDENESPDSDYDNLILPEPDINYKSPRYNGQATPDGNGVVIITSTAGNYAEIAIYPGTENQPVDPVIQAAVDGKRGAGSTPAYRGVCYVRFKQFNLSKFGGAVPQFVFRAESQTLTTLDKICADLCRRAGLAESDFNFSNLADIKVRGFLINSRQPPRQALEILGRMHRVDFFEEDGVIRAVKRASQVPIIIPESDLGALEGPPREDLNEPPELVRMTILDTPQLPRQFEVKYFDTRRDGQSNLHREQRFTARTSKIETLDIPATLIPREAKLLAQQELYRLWTERYLFNLSLPPKYGYLKASDVIQTTIGGFTYQIYISEIGGTLPASLKITGVGNEISVFDPEAAADGGDFDPYPVGIPAQTVATLFNIPELLPGNTRLGYYGAAAARGVGDWPGAGLYKDSGLGFEKIADFKVQATMGVAVGALAGFTGTGNDNTNKLTVELYQGTLESAASGDLDKGANLLLVGNEVIQFQNATQVAGFTRRFEISNLRRGQKNTSANNSSHVAGERVVVLNSAVVFIPTVATETGKERTYKAVTIGQTVDDAASFTYTWEGSGLEDTDTGPPDITKVALASVKSEVLPEDRVQVRLALKFLLTPDGRIDPSANMRSVDFCEITGFDRFGGTVLETSEYPFSGFGQIAEAIHSRTFADPLSRSVSQIVAIGDSEATYRVRIHNRFGYSEPLWIANEQASTQAPTFDTASSHPTCIATPDGETTTTITWQYAGSEQLEIYRRLPKYARPLGSTASTNWLKLTTVATNSGSYQATNLAPNQIYEWRLRTLTNGFTSNITSRKTFEGAVNTLFPAPINLTLFVNNGLKITLNWTRNSTTNTATQIWRGGVLIATIDGTRTSYADETVQQNTTYPYQVRHVYGTEYSAFSNTATETTGSDLPAPSILSSSGWSDSAGSTRVRIFWSPQTDSPQHTGFEVYRNSVLIATLGKDVWIYNDTGLSPSTAYTYQVKNKFGALISLAASITETTKSSGSPTAPSGLGGTVISDTQINVNWTNNTGTPNPNIIWAAVGDYTAANSAQVSPGTTSYSITGLTPGKKYHIVVAHYYSSPFDTSLYSNELVLTTNGAAAAYPAPVNLQVLPFSTSQINLTWDRNTSSNTATEVWRDGVLLTTLPATATSYNDTGLSAGTQHSYKIRHAYSGSNYSDFTPDVSATTQSSSSPAPSNLQGTAVSATQIDLAWQRNTSSNTAVQLYRNGSLYATLSASATTYSDTGLTPNTTYTYQVKNQFAGPVYSAFSNQVNVTTQAGNQYPAPTNLTVSATGINSAQLNWLRNSGTNTQVKVYRGLGSSGAFQLVATLGAAIQTYTDTGVVPATTYRYKVANVYTGGFESESGVVTATTPADNNFPAPSSLVATTISPTQINLSWTPNTANNTGVEVYLSTNGTFYGLLVTLPAGSNSYSNTGLNPATQYWYQVVNTFGGVNKSAFSNVATATTQASASFPAPTLVAAAVTAPGQVTVNWNRNSSTNDGAQVWREEIFGSNPTLLGTVGASTTTFIDTTGVPGTTYYYKVRNSYSGNFSIFAAASGGVVFPSTLTPPSNLTVTATSTQATLNWLRNTSSNSATEIKRSDWIFPVQVSASATSWVDNSVLPNQVYSYQVRHIYPVNQVSAWSNEASVTIPTGPYAVPVNFQAVAISQSQINLSWDVTNTSYTSFEIYRNGALLATTANKSFSDTGLTANTSYRYKIRAVYPGPNYSEFTTEIIVTTPQPSTPAPSNLRVTGKSDFHVALAWQRNATNNDKVQVWRSVAGGAFSLYQTFDDPATDTFTDFDVLPSTQYGYQVRNRFGSGTFSAFSNTANVITDPPSGV